MKTCTAFCLCTFYMSRKPTVANSFYFFSMIDLSLLLLGLFFSILLVDGRSCEVIRIISAPCFTISSAHLHVLLVLSFASLLLFIVFQVLAAKCFLQGLTTVVILSRVR
jgi:hypothetical protein